MTTDRLHAVDEAYLELESPMQPLHVGSIGFFRGPGLLDSQGELRLDAVRERVAARLHLLPRLRQRVVEVPLDVARPVWSDDPNFDIANHIDAVDIGPSATDDDVLAHVEALMMQPLDRNRPLWHLRLLTGLTDDRVALVQRAHHAMIDGVSGVDVSITLLDTEPESHDDAVPAWTPDRTPRPLELVADGVRDRIGEPVERARAILESIRDPASLARGIHDAGTALRSMTGAGIRAPRCSLNAPLGPTRRIQLVRNDLESIHAVGQQLDATVNDVVLTAVAGGLRALFLSRHEEVDDERTVHVLVPVSTRADEGGPSLGNQVGGIVAPLPVGIGDPTERLLAVAASMRALKASHEADLAGAAMDVLDLLPPRLAHLLQHRIDHQPLVNMVVTNVPGPPFPLYALGSELVEAFPLVPLGARMTLEVAVLSYDGALTLGVVSDRIACPDAPTFTEGVEASFASLGAVRPLAHQS